MLHPSYIAEQSPDHPAYIMAATGETVTYGQLNEASNRGAQLLRALGIKRGDHIAMYIENNPFFFQIVWAAQRAGVYYTPISYYLKLDEVEYILADCRAKVFITSYKQKAIVSQINRQKLEALEHAYMIDGECEGYPSWEDAISSQPVLPISDESEGREMLYSSGTTGRPKGIKLPLDEDGAIGETERVKQESRFTSGFGIGKDTVFLSTSPLYHSAPFGYCMGAFRVGATCVIMEKFDAQESLRLIQDYKITYSQWVPTMFVRMLKLPDEIRLKYDISSMKTAIHGSAPCAVSVKEAMIDWWGEVFVEFYSGSERYGIFMISSPEWLQHKGSVGRCVDAQVHIIDEATGEELPEGEIGAIYTSGASDFIYHNDKEKTASTRLSQNNKLSTIGDIGYLGKDGYLYLTDRKSYTIISGGVNVYPQEAEDVLIAHPDVFDVAVFGVPNEDLGEEVKAVVQLMDYNKAGAEIESELIQFTKQRLSSIKCPRSIDFDEELPREDTGKLKKRLIKDRYWP